MRYVLAILLGAFIPIGAPSQSRGRVEAHAYYLFLASPPKGCEGCYVPLLVTATRLEDLAKQKQDEQCTLITTYERDSLVGNPRLVAVSPAAVRPKERIVSILDGLYRYQEIGAEEVLLLLEHPDGKIAISRIDDMRVPSADQLSGLIARFRTVKE